MTLTLGRDNAHTGLQRTGVITRQQSKLLVEIDEVRSGLQHWYPDVLGPEIHGAVTQLLAQLTPLTARLRTWVDDDLA